MSQGPLAGRAEDSGAVPGARLEVMNFLNEVAGRYPRAISLASGRPAAKFFDLPAWMGQMSGYLDAYASQHGLAAGGGAELIAQYGPTAGIIGPLLARQLRTDEAIECEAGQILITAGCQEAIDMCVREICVTPGDVILASSPTYIGITGVAQRNGVPIEALHSAPDLLNSLSLTIAALASRGQRARLLYLVPNFDNPTGATIDEATRTDVIALCAQHEILILEDNPYGMFRYEGRHQRSMFSLDSFGCVIYLGTYSKTLCPALRVGFAVLPRQLMGQPEAARKLMERLVQAKSFMTVNTSQITQAIVGGVLLANDCTLAPMIAPAIEHYRRNRDAMLAALQLHLGDLGQLVRWNRPEGGFFLVVELPFEFGEREAEICAAQYEVLVMPLSFFSLDRRDDQRVRLAFSNSEPERQAEGVQRFARFVTERLRARP